MMLRHIVLNAYLSRLSGGVLNLMDDLYNIKQLLESRMKKYSLITGLVLLSLIAPAQAQGKSNQKGKQIGSSKLLPKKKQVPKGRLLLDVYECLSCHTLNGEGNKDGVGLNHLKRTRSFLIEHILDPETHVQKNPKAYANEPNLMPSYQLSRKEAADIADYLLTLNKTKGNKKAKH